jgi:hypothetical protein
MTRRFKRRNRKLKLAAAAQVLAVAFLFSSVSAMSGYGDCDPGEYEPECIGWIGSFNPGWYDWWVELWECEDGWETNTVFWAGSETDPEQAQTDYEAALWICDQYLPDDLGS